MRDRDSIGTLESEGGRLKEPAPLKVLVVDDSAVVRQVMTSILSRHKGIISGGCRRPMFCDEKDGARPA